MEYRPDYLQRLFATIADYEGRSFEFGVRDCALFGSDIVLALNGHDPADQWRGKYKTAIGGLRHLRKAGFQDQADFVRKSYPNEIDEPFAQVGDLAIIAADGDTGHSIGVVASGFLIAIGPHGLVRLPMNHAVSIHRVGGIQ